jgi:hypothetical protein
MDIIKISGVSFNANYLRAVSEDEAVITHPKLPKTEVIRAWKRANGKSMPKPRKTEK